MTTLNPSHNIFRPSEGRHAQAVYRADDADADAGPSSSPADDASDSDSLSVDGDAEGLRQARRAARKRVRAQVPPMPDLRFEQSYLLSIRPFLTPRPDAATKQEKGPVPGKEEKEDSNTLTTGAENDEVFHWGREVDVNWRMLSWVTIRDQIFSPLVQGALWGWAGLFLGASSAAFRSALYPSSHVPKGRIVGGPGSSTDAAGGGSAVGGGGWWRNWVKSLGGAVQSATV